MKKVLVSVLMVMITIVVMLAMATVAFAAIDDAASVDTDVALTGVFAAIIMLAVLIEALAEVVKAALSPAALPKWAWFIITSTMGSVLCIMFSIDMFAALGFVGGAAAIIIGQIITGIAVGAGSGFVHTLLGKLTASKNADKVIATSEPLSLIENTVVSNKTSNKTTSG